MVNNVCKYSMCVKLLRVLIKPRLIFYAEVTPLKINRWKRKHIIRQWGSLVLQGRNFHACRIERTVTSGRHCLPLAAHLLLHLSSCWVNCSKHICFLFKIL